MTELEHAFSDLDVRHSTKVAALDLGSNSFHLVVARIMAGSVQILHKVKLKVRLADGLNDKGELSEDAIQRGLDALSLLSDSMRDLHPDSVRIVATYTLRKATNAKSFIRRAREILPYPIEVIAGIEEARLIYQGVAHTSAEQGRRLVIDIGGGSTEFAIGEGFEPRLMRSLQMGCVSFTKAFFDDGSLKEKRFKAAITRARQELEMVDRKFRQMGWDLCIGTSGTIRTLVELAADLPGKNVEGCVSIEQLQRLKALCTDAGHIDKLKLAELSDDRRPVLAAGLSVLIAVFESLKIKQLRYSSAALREGVIYEMEERLQHHDIRERTAQSLATRYDIDAEHAGRVLTTTRQLYDSIAKEWGIAKPEYASLLGWASLLHEVGLQINSRRVQHHSAYILQHAELPGFNVEQQDLLATLARFHRKKVKLTDIHEYAQFPKSAVPKLIAILRLGVLLNLRRQDDFLPQIDIKAGNKQIQLKFPKHWLEQEQLLCADIESEKQQFSELGLSLKAE